jgi:hypothetical protein
MKVTIEATKAEVLALLTGKANGHDGAARMAGTKDAKARENGRAEGLREAIQVLNQWQEPPGEARSFVMGSAAGMGAPADGGGGGH